MDYQLRQAIPEDHEWIYACKRASIRPYVEAIWGWNESFQQQDFDGDFASIGQFRVIETSGKPIGFLQVLKENDCVEVAELHLLPDYREQGIGSSILRRLLAYCQERELTLQLGCFKENYRAKALYQRLGFRQVEETETHCILAHSPTQMIPM